MLDKRFQSPERPVAAAAPEIKAPERWSRQSVETLMQSSQLADWARAWLGKIQQEGGQLDELLQDGLCGSMDIPAWMARGAPVPQWLLEYLRRADVATIWFNEGFLVDDPPWLAQLLRQEHARVTRSFLLNGNVNDYAFDPVKGYRPSIRVLADALARQKDCVLSYRLSQGLVLHTPGIRDRLPEFIHRHLDSSALSGDSNLSMRLCVLFDDLRRWLSGTSEGIKIHDLPRGVAIIFENVHLLIPQNRGDIERNFLVDNLLLWSISPELFRSNHCLILQAEALEDVGSELRARGGKIEQIELPRPGSTKERLKFLLTLLDANSGMNETRVSRLPQGIGFLNQYGQGNSLERLRLLSRDTAGLTLIGIEDLMQEVSADQDRGLSRDEVMRLKGQRLRQESQGLIEVLEPRRDLSTIGGYEALKVRLLEVVASLRNSTDELALATIPMGILFFGPPGTGKSIVAESLAGECHISLAKLGDFRGMYVGESERNLSRILSLINSLHPVIVFIDEIDQALGKRGGTSPDGGVDNRIFGRLLEFMSDTTHRGNILWIGASNFPDKIDPAMKRPGRFDLILPFLLPDEESRAAILEVSVKGAMEKVKRLRSNLDQNEFRALAKRTDRFSGAELNAVVAEVLRRASVRNRFEGDVLIDVALFHTVLDVYAPPVGVRESYAEMERLALSEISFSDLIPERYRRTSAEGTHDTT
jgi:transitional endoplasmic reticulum ATPase